MFSLAVSSEVELRLAQPEYAETVFKLVQANYGHLHAWMPWCGPETSVESIREFYRQALNKFAIGGDELASVIFVERAPAGGIGFHRIDRASRSAEIGYWLAKNHEGKGIVTEAVKRFLEYGFGFMNFHRIVIKCASGNARSRAVPKRLGFREEGTEREAGWLHTRFVDHVVYAMLSGEWGQGSGTQPRAESRAST